jgi:hypothetical protein
MTDATELADRYVAMWNEPDPDRRTAAIAALWTEDAVHLLQAPEEVREIAARPGIGLDTWLQARGHAALQVRATSAYERFIAGGDFTFRRRDDVERVADAVKFRWEMVSASGEVAGVGLEVLIVDGAGRIQRDYQFIES